MLDLVCEALAVGGVAVEMLTVRNNLAQALSSQGKYAEAEKMRR